MHRPISATLAFSSAGEPNFADASGAFHDVANERILGNLRYDMVLFIIGQSRRFGVAEEGWGADDRCMLL
jgi:hypothetical protein